MKMYSLLAAGSLLFSAQANAATLTFVSFSDRVPILDAVLEGEIVAGDFENLKSKLKEHGPDVRRLFLFSPGGNALEAMKIGEMIRSLQIRTVGPRPDFDDDPPRPSCPIRQPKSAANCVCYSSCFLIWIAGVDREESLLGVHRPSFDRKTYAAMSPDAAEKAYTTVIVAMQAYLGRFSVPEDLKEQMVSTASRNIHAFVSPSEMTGMIPAYDELLDARCNLMSREEQGQFWLIRTKIKEKRASDDEIAAFGKLEKHYNEASRCSALESLIMRVDAFSKYFGVDYKALMQGKR